MWPDPCGTGVTPKYGVPVALAAWQVVQPELMPVCCIWVPAKLVKFPAAWQVSHVAVVGTWFVGLVLRLVTPVNALPVSWQVAQPLVIPVCCIPVPGPNLDVEA